MDACYRFRQYRLLPGRRLLLEGADESLPVKLGGRAFDMLLALVERHDRIVSKNELMNLVWPRLVVEENNLQVQVLALRKLLGHGAIATIPGRGYRFTLPLVGDPETPLAPAAAVAVCNASQDGNMPGCIPELLGRDDELRELQGLIDEHALVTVTGAGGIGKTRLAQGAAAQRAQRQAVWWVELAPLADAALVPAAVGQALGLRLEGGVDAGAAVARALEGKAALVVLDNAEHLLDGVAAFVSSLRGRATGVKVLVTSQEVMHGLEEQVFRPGPLALPSGDDFAAAQASGAVALFVARARQVDPRFALRDDNFAAVAEICRKLDGIPLAIELAAARVPLLGVEGVRQRLDERFQMLTAGARAVMRRHQTLRAALEWSHGLLADAERVVFRRLGVFAGGFALDAAQALACDEATDGWEVLEHLGALVDKSLVVVEGDPVPRYRMLETTRMFALERLADAGETEALLERHALWCVELAEAFDAEAVRLGCDTAGPLDRLDVERPNLLHALAWCGPKRGPVAALYGLRLAAALRFYWPSRGLSVLGLGSTQQALDGASELPGDRYRCTALGSVVQLLASMNRIGEAAPLVRELMTLGKALSLVPAISAAHHWSGWIAMHRQAWQEAMANFEAARALAKQTGSLNHEGHALGGLARVAHAQGRLDEAAALVEELLDVRRRSGHGQNIAVSLQLATSFALSAGDTERAAAHLREAEPWVRRVGSRLLSLGWCSMNVALAATHHRWPLAVQLHAHVVQRRKDDGVRPDDEGLASEATEIRSAREALGIGAFDAAWAQGKDLSEQEAMDLAVAQLSTGLTAGG